MMTDPIADMLTRIRNAGQARLRRVDMPTSKLKQEIARILKENHYIYDYKVLEDEHSGTLRLYLKYHRDNPVIRELHRVSSPGRRRYVGMQDIPRVRNGLGLAILTTSRGVLTDSQARSARVGGEVLAYVW